MTNINTIVLEEINKDIIGPGGNIPDGSGPPIHGKHQGPGKGKEDKTGLENLQKKILDSLKGKEKK